MKTLLLWWQGREASRSIKYFCYISLFVTSLECRLANCPSVYRRSDYIYPHSSVVVVLLEREGFGVVSGVCWLALRAVSLGISSPTVGKVLGLCFVHSTVVS